MNKRIAARILITIGVLFIIYAIFGRYLVLPGYLKALESKALETATSTASKSITEGVPFFKILRMALWMLGFKLGVIFSVIGLWLHTNIKPSRVWIPALGGLLYITFFVIPIPGPYPIFFGIGGVSITLFFIMILWHWVKCRAVLDPAVRKLSDFRMIGLVFFVIATHNLCGFTGVITFVLYPEKMLAYGLKEQAAGLSAHIMIEFVLGWFFSYLGSRTAISNRLKEKLE